MSDIKLIYFNARGLTEISRLILAYAGVQYTDERLDSIQSIKSSLPYGQVPALIYKGETLCQSRTIARFLANEFGLAGRTNLEKGQADEIVDTLMDLMMAGYKLLHAQDDTEAKPAEEATFGEASTKLLTQLEARLKGRGGQYFVGNSPTWADILLFCVTDAMKAAMPTMLANFPLQKDLAERVGAVPNIKEWVESRPVTKM